MNKLLVISRRFTYYSIVYFVYEEHQDDIDEIIQMDQRIHLIRNELLRYKIYFMKALML